MARVLRGFPAQGVVACFTEPNTTGDPLDFNAPRNAPAKSPLQNLSRIAFHSDLAQFELAMPMQTKVITHPSVATASVVWNVAGTIILSYTVTGQQLGTWHTLVTHNLGYTPLVMVAYDGSIIVGGRMVQSEGQRRRFVSVFADSSIVGLAEVGYSDGSALSSVSRTYQVLIFREPAADPDLPLFSGDANGFQIDRGKINSDALYLRHGLAQESSFDFDLGRTVDIQNGGARVVSGGVTVSDPAYDGSFAGSSFVPVKV